MPRYKLDIYIPYMGCPCSSPGPAQDKDADNFHDTLLALKDRHKDDIAYMIYALNQHLQQFKARPELTRILQNQGKTGLPAIFINDVLVHEGSYPALEEMELMLGNADSSHEQI